LFIPDQDPDFLPIPDPGVKKAPDPGSGTLIRSHHEAVLWSIQIIFGSRIWIRLEVKSLEPDLHKRKTPDPDLYERKTPGLIRIKEKSLELWRLTKNRGGSAWKHGRTVGQWLQTGITLMRSRIRIRIKVKIWIGIGIRIKVKSKIWINIKRKAGSGSASTSFRGKRAAVRIPQKAAQ
jgi:hypothetical protein